MVRKECSALANAEHSFGLLPERCNFGFHQLDLERIFGCFGTGQKQKDEFC
jgi:hypothetical protein